MRICMLADARSIHTMRWVKTFTEKNHEVHLISFEHSIIGQSKNLKYYKINNHLFTQICVYFIPRPELYKPFLKDIRKMINEINPDIVHAHYLTNYGIIGSLLDFRPFVISIWGTDVLVTPYKYKTIRWMDRYALKKADVVTTIPEIMKQHIVDLFKIEKSKIIRIPWGIDLNVFHAGYKEEVKSLKKSLGIPANSTIILSNRAISPHYNIKSIIKAIPTVIRNSKNTIFIFTKGYGKEKYFEEVCSLVEELGVTKNTLFVNKFIEPNEMAVYLNMADILISIPKTDQFSSSIMEGMACGTIPIVGDLEVYKQYLQENKNALFVNRNNPEEIAQKILYYIENPQIKEQFHLINKEIIETYENWNVNANKMYDLYASLVYE